MTTRAAMKTRIANELIRSDLTTEIADAITTAIDHYKYQRWFFNETQGSTTTTTAGVESYNPPTSFLSLDALRLKLTATQSRKLEQIHWDSMEQYREDSDSDRSEPYYFAEYQNKYFLWPTPVAVYTLAWSGLTDTAPTSDSQTSNPWMTFGEALIRQRARSIVQIDVLRDEGALTQAAAMASRGLDTLGLLEQSALTALIRENVRRTTSGRLRPSDY